MQTTDIIQSFRKDSSLVYNVIREFKETTPRNIFFVNKTLLVRKSKTVAFDNPKWFLRPESFSYDYYGDKNFFLIILLVNNISSRFNFRYEQFTSGIITPNIQAIQEVLALK